MPRRGFSPFIPVWTRASTSSGERRFFAATAAISASRAREVRPSVDVYDLTGDLVVFLAFQVSDDGETWPAASTFTILGASPISRNGDGVTCDTVVTDISASLTAAFVRFGFVVRNDTVGTRIEFALVSGRFELMGCG